MRLLPPELRLIISYCCLNFLHVAFSSISIEQSGYWMRFPSLGDRKCSSYGYHEESLASIICDPERLIGRTSAWRLKSILATWWRFCGDETDTFDFRTWTLAVLLTKDVGLPHRCNETRNRFADDHKVNLNIARLVREEWSQSCPIDMLLVISENFCSSRKPRVWKIVAAVSLSDELSSNFERFSPDAMEDVFSKELQSLRGEEAEIMSLALYVIHIYQQRIQIVSRRDVDKIIDNRKIHTIPLWAWLVFGGATFLTFACAFIGNYVGSSRFSRATAGGGLAQGKKNWGAGFGGGMMKFRDGQGQGSSKGRPHLFVGFRR